MDEVGKGRKPKRPAAGAAELGEREILGALLAAGEEMAAPSGDSLSWRSLALSPEKLRQGLEQLARPRSKAAANRLAAFAEDFAARYRLRVSNIDDLELPLPGGRVRVPRWLAGQALGALGDDLLPTRRRVRRLGTEAARELAYFGYGLLGQQVLPHPIALVRAALAGQDALRLEPVLLDEQDEAIGRAWTVFDLLRTDGFFHRQVESEAELGRFQQRLREDPLDGNAVVRLRAFFSRRATIGLRDTTRWALGSRHPWFGWERARELIAACFERWGSESFLCPQVSLYGVDAAIGDEELGPALEANERVVQRFAAELEQGLAPLVREQLAAGALPRLARAALDCHYDHPDFELEARGRQGGETTARFAGHALWIMAANAAGRRPEPRRNVNLVAHFAAKGYDRRWLAGLDDDQRASFYLALNDLVRRLDETGGLVDERGRRLVYRRLPLVIYTFYETPAPRPRPGETVVDSFGLDALQAPQHARHLQDYPEVFEKLVVFFSLVLRHYLDTDHAPDLRPENMLRDYMLLGLWGTNAPNLVVNLYRDDKGRRRSEVRFVGRGQFKAYRPEQDRKHEAALAHMLASQPGPLLEPGMLRALGTFLMAAEEHRRGSRVRDVGAVAFTRHSLELFREAARSGIKSSLVDVATMIEMLVDNAVDAAQRSLDRLAGQSDSEA